jgi:hypothetical protein
MAKRNLMVYSKFSLQIWGCGQLAAGPCAGGGQSVYDCGDCPDLPTILTITYKSALMEP